MDDDLLLIEAEEALAFPLLEDPFLEEEAAARVIVPSKGKVFDKDGACRVAVIRPCVSRGKRLRGLPPIYTQEMLAENSPVFSNWLMFMDHLSEAIVETMRRRGRSIRELGGRVLRSGWDRDFTTPKDKDYGYQRGAVVARVLPQPPVRAMLEADPQILNVSINAFPTSAKEGTAPWDRGLKGMLVEGIRAKPEGSVDWVPRGGAGGHVLEGAVEEMVQILESFYEDGPAEVSPSGSAYPARPRSTMPKNLNEMTAAELREHLNREAPTLAQELGITSAPPAATPPATPPAPPAATGLSEADLETMLAERERLLEAKFEARVTSVEEAAEERAQELLAEREGYVSLQEHAHQLIESSGLPPEWQADLKRRYSVLPSGPTDALLVEAEGEKDEETMLGESVAADVKHAFKLIEAAGGRTPRVTGLGSGSEGAEGVRANKPRNTAFREWALSEGVIEREALNKIDQGVQG